MRSRGFSSAPPPDLERPLPEPRPCASGSTRAEEVPAACQKPASHTNRTAFLSLRRHSEGGRSLEGLEATLQSAGFKNSEIVQLLELYAHIEGFKR